ncbi:DeoR/GlpR family DNA-binding transcription regulator [Alicyclobacillus shizuokensis]|uniref:DeoR/GlpR family DNA-binding transcription regulator n=1 Tax=Alicyclobacillus shizuokensis TaxID=392014 RepID=UPI00082DBDF6|nr:DeoR/GlpR family DNA-binding transcription regulator [Alicyclobacillus shizuokensis]
MLAAQRRKEIYHMLATRGQVELQELAAHFQVSMMTIRRDLEQLEQEGKARRVHGGAIVGEQKWMPDSLEVKSTANIQQKQAVARKVMTLLKPNRSIFLDAGSTAYEVAKELTASFLEPLTVCTPDLQIALLLSQTPRFQVYACGGLVDSATASFGGAFATRMIRSLHADLALIGCDGLTLKDGAMSARVEQVSVKQAMMERSLQVALMTDSSKLGRVSFATIAPLHAFDYAVMDDGVDETLSEGLKKSGVQVV